MTAQRVLHWPDPKLKNVAKPIVDITCESILGLARDLKDTMRVELGAGLAAMQIARPEAMVVIEGSYASAETLDLDPNLKDVIVLVNPTIKAIDDKTFEWQEACLSVPEYMDAVSRASDINVSYSDTAGILHSKNVSAPFSGIIQHEVDHLSGILYLDRLSKSKKKRAESILRSRIKKKRDALKKATSKDSNPRVPPDVRNGFRTKPTRIKMSGKKNTKHKKN